MDAGKRRGGEGGDTDKSELINHKDEGIRKITHFISNIKTDKRYERRKINEES